MQSSGYSKRFNTIVIGVGGMGSAACYELAKRGKRVLGIEQFNIPNDMGSSHGYTRIIRLAYYEHPSYVMLLRRAYELWSQLEARSGKQIYVRTGSIDAGPADSWVFKGSLKSCVEHGLEHEVLSGMEINARFPGYNLPHDLLGVFQPDGGFVLPELAIVTYVQAAHALGAEIHGREEVLEWRPLSNGEGVRVLTDRAEYEADSLVITGGAWSARLLPFLQRYAVPERQVLAWLQPERPELFAPERFPVFNLLVPEGRYYGFPVHTVPGFKFGKYHHFEEVVQPETYDREPNFEDEEVLLDFAGRYFPQGAGPIMTLKTCMFTNSPDKHFIIDLHPEFPQVSFAAGFSGHGYKFASVIGEVMADLAERRESRHNITLFNVARLTGKVSELYQNMPGMRVSAKPVRYAHLGQHPNSRRQGSRLGSRAARRVIPSQRIPSQHGLQGDSYLETNDPRYWEKEDIKPFW
jgi:sarcosine oxidase